MANTQPRPIEIGFPIQGLDRSLPARNQPQFTTYELMNVRAFPPSSDRLGGGSREGYSKLFTQVAGTVEAPRITGLDVLTESTNITDPNSYSEISIVEDWSGVADADPADLGGDWHYYAIDSTVTLPNEAAVASSILTLKAQLSRSSIIMSSYFVQQANGVSVTITASAQCATTTSGFGASGQPTLIGPILAVASNNGRGVLAALAATASNKAKLRISLFNGTSTSMLFESAEFTLSGSATTASYVISLTNTDGVLEARVQATGVLSGSLDLDVTLAGTTTETGLRGGLFYHEGSSTITRTITEISLTQLHPPTSTVYANLDKGLANTTDGNRYFIPATWSHCRLASGAVTVSAAGPTSASYSTSPASTPNGPFVDTVSAVLRCSNYGQGSASFETTHNWAVFTGDATVQHGVEIEANPGTPSDSAGDIAMPVFRISEDFKDGLMIKHRAINHEPDTGMSKMDLTSGLMDMLAVVGGVGTKLNNPSGSAISIAWHRDNKLRITDDGTNIKIYINGMLVHSFTPSSLPDWTSTIENALAGNTRVGFTNASAPTVSSLNSTMGSVRIVQGETPADLVVSNVKNKLAIYSPSIVQIGDTEDRSISDVSGPNLVNPLPSSASFNRKFYAVDGSRSLIINPATLTSEDWAPAVLAGTLPVGCQHVEFFRGSAYLAATDSDPTIWYKSRTLDPLDFDFGADPQVSSAVAGNNGEVGQPADAITALFGYSSDYLFFGMARSLGVLEGDPGYGGQFQIISNEAGIVGPRAYCFDDRGNLYFLGAGGLYRMFRAQFDPEPVGPRKLRRALEELDTSTNLIQMAFRPSDRTVRIYITPTDGETIGTYFVYDTRTDGFYSDQIPLEHGPWSIAQTTGVEDIDRNIIIGGNDGTIRRPDDDATSDDGTAITSWVEIVIPEEGSGGIETICQEIQFVMGEGGGTVRWYWFVGNSPEEVRLQTVDNLDYVDSGSISSTGFRPPIGLRQTGASHKIRLESSSDTERWSLERLTAQMAMTNNRRR